MLFLGCDGGSTKTEVLLADERGALRARFLGAGCNFAFLGDSGFRARMAETVGGALRQAGARAEDLTHAVFGLPAYGELPETETAIPAALRELLPDVPLRIENDALMGHAGSLRAGPGIHIVSGTGAVACGVDPAGHTARAGGWSLLLSDEGSCSWVGRKAVEAFVKQADGRLPRTALYGIVREACGLTRDQYFCGDLVRCTRDSARTAEFQRCALAAARQGDGTMVCVYRDAAAELAALAPALRGRLDFPAGEPVRVSYSGGLFHAGELVLAPFLDALRQEGFTTVTPAFPPNVGALALAAAPYLDAAGLEAFMARAAEALAG